MHRTSLLVSLVGLALALVAGCETTEKTDGGVTPPPDSGPPPAGFHQGGYGRRRQPFPQGGKHTPRDKDEFCLFHFNDRS